MHVEVKERKLSVRLTERPLLQRPGRLRRPTPTPRARVVMSQRFLDEVQGDQPLLRKPRVVLSSATDWGKTGYSKVGYLLSMEQEQLPMKRPLVPLTAALGEVFGAIGTSPADVTSAPLVELSAVLAGSSFEHGLAEIICLCCWLDSFPRLNTIPWPCSRD